LQRRQRDVEPVENECGVGRPREREVHVGEPMCDSREPIRELARELKGSFLEKDAGRVRRKDDGRVDRSGEPGQESAREVRSQSVKQGEMSAGPSVASVGIESRKSAPGRQRRKKRREERGKGEG